LIECQFADHSLSELQGLPKRRKLVLYDSRITDLCFDEILKLRNLEDLRLMGTDITEEGALRLVEMKQLNSVALPVHFNSARRLLQQENFDLTVHPVELF
jgi:hypothetical protein